jgi:hypothetical protein
LSARKQAVQLLGRVRQLLGGWAGWLASWLDANVKVGAFPQRASAETVACA